MFKKLLIITLIIGGMSCDPENKTTEQTIAATTDSPVTNNNSRPGPVNPSDNDWSGCYSMSIEKDSAFMQIEKNAGGYQGKLEYKRFEKDSNKGEVSLLEDDKYLKGWYRFQSEGVLSVREVYFRKTFKGLEEGYGEITMVSDTALFKYPATLDYESRHPFQKTNCN